MYFFINSFHSFHSYSIQEPVGLTDSLTFIRQMSSHCLLMRIWHHNRLKVFEHRDIGYISTLIYVFSVGWSLPVFSATFLGSCLPSWDISHIPLLQIYNGNYRHAFRDESVTNCPITRQIPASSPILFVP